MAIYLCLHTEEQSLRPRSRVQPQTKLRSKHSFHVSPPAHPSPHTPCASFIHRHHCKENVIQSASFRCRGVCSAKQFVSAPLWIQWIPTILTLYRCNDWRKKSALKGNTQHSLHEAGCTCDSTLQLSEPRTLPVVLPVYLSPGDKM